jgi:hypothetical protein
MCDGAKIGVFADWASVRIARRIVGNDSEIDLFRDI